MAFDPNSIDSIKQFYEGYRGWNDNSAILADFRNTGGSGKGAGPGGGMGSGNQALDSAIRQQQEGINQSVSALQGQQNLLPQQTAQRASTLNQQASTLEQRYKSLIDDIKGQTNQQVTRQTTTTANELGRRGITSNSGLFEQTLTDALNPINQAGQTNLTNTGIARESDMSAITQALNQLPLDEQSQRLALQQAIGQVQAGGGESAVQSALQMLQNQQQQQQFGQNLDFQKQQLAQSSYRNPLEDQFLQAQIADIQSQTSNRNKPAAKTFNLSDWE